MGKPPMTLRTGTVWYWWTGTAGARRTLTTCRSKLRLMMLASSKSPVARDPCSWLVAPSRSSGYRAHFGVFVFVVDRSMWTR